MAIIKVDYGSVGGSTKDILALWDLCGSGASGANTINGGYNEDIFEYVSGSFRQSNTGTGTITLKSKVSGTLNIERAYGTSWGNLSVGGTAVTPDKTTQVSVNAGDTVVWESTQYYNQIVISYTK